MKEAKKMQKLLLIGAGPGDPDLVTVKAIKALAEADVILYDALVNPELLDYCRERSLKIYVGKRAGKHSFHQDEINMLIARYAASHGIVARLKGGDPFVFGRGWEELAFARARGIDVEVIPGISSALSVPAIQGIPLTLRSVSESFWVITGTTRSGTLSADVRLAARSTATVIILMGMRKIHDIMELFKSEGRNTTGAAVVMNGSLPEEKICIGTVATICKRAMEAQMTAPAIIIIGDVVDKAIAVRSPVISKIGYISETN